MNKKGIHVTCPIEALVFSFGVLCIISLSIFLFSTNHVNNTSLSMRISTSSDDHIKVYVANLPRSFNYGLLEEYWSPKNYSRLGDDEDEALRSRLSFNDNNVYPPAYPENPLIKQYSAEYWLLGDLMTPEDLRPYSFAKRVLKEEDADVIFVPFFATLSAEMQLGKAKGKFRQKNGNEDYERQRKVVDMVKESPMWKKSGGRNHVFVLTDPVAMWHVRAEIAPAVLLVVDFGGWYKVDSKYSDGNSSAVVHHTQVSLIKDVIVPYTHLLPRLLLSEDQKRKTLLYFKGAKHRHRGGLVREALWNLLINEPGVLIEEGFPNAKGREQSIRGMRTSEFCLHPAGDTPTSCRLFDAILSLCIPVVVSDSIELPFEGMVDYMEFSVFVSVNDALKPNWLLNHLRSFSLEQKDSCRQKLSQIQPIFEYDNGQRGGIGPVPVDGAVNHIWRKVFEKLPAIKAASTRQRRIPDGVTIPARCHCT